MSLLLLIALSLLAAAVAVFLFAAPSVSFPKLTYRRLLTFVVCTVLVALAANAEAGWFRDHLGFWRWRANGVRQFYSNSVFADPFYAPRVVVGYDQFGRPLVRDHFGRLLLLQQGTHCPY